MHWAFTQELVLLYYMGKSIDNDLMTDCPLQLELNPQPSPICICWSCVFLSISKTLLYLSKPLVCIDGPTRVWLHVASRLSIHSSTPTHKRQFNLTEIEVYFYRLCSAPYRVALSTHLNTSSSSANLQQYSATIVVRKWQAVAAVMWWRWWSSTHDDGQILYLC